MYNDKLHSPAQRIITLDTLKTNPWQWWVFGRHLVETKNFDKAIAYLSKGLDIAPSGTLLLKDMAHSYLFKGNFTKAIELYRQCLKLGQNELSKRLKDDFDYFRNAGFDDSVIKKASEMLSL
jgi:tetratricopeptide (TPR) repeat protein